MSEDCWCQPHAVECFAERMIVHHPEETAMNDRWWAHLKHGRSPDEYTDDLVRVGAARGIFRECAIGWHLNCSDWSGDSGCTCRCHEIAEKAILEARRSGELQ